MDKFSYTYSAEQQEEVKGILKKYVKPEEDKMEQLRKLDASATSKATMLALVVGIVGTLIMGTGMSLCLVWTDKLLIPGIIIGIIGLAIAGVGYPLYSSTLKKERERIAPEIMRLAEELLKQSVDFFDK